MRSFVADVRLAVRLLRRSPSTTAIALFSIALSVGATAVVFAAVKAVLLDPLPFVHPERLVLLRGDNPHDQQQSLGDWAVWNDVVEIERRARTIASIGVWSNAVFDLAGDTHTPPESVYGIRVNAKLLPTLGVPPLFGRYFAPGEDLPERPTEMILSYGLWLRRFHADPSIVGRNVTIAGHDCLVIGVMPAGFNFPMRREAAHLPRPYVEFWATPFQRASNPGAGVGAAARLRPGVSLAEARQDIAAISRALVHDFPALNRDRVLTIAPVRERFLGSAPKNLWLLMAASGLFMLIGCANVANLQLARGLARRREIAVRVALGAGSGRIVRQLLTESCVLALLGGLCGFALTALAWKLLPSLAPRSIPRLAGASADTGVLGFSLLIAVANGILFGILPAFRLTAQRGAGSAGFHSEASTAGRRDRTRSALIAAEVALSVLLVVLGSQALASFTRLISTDPGFAADRVLASVLLAAPERYPIGSQKREMFYRHAVEDARAISGVESAGTVDALPFSGENHGGFVSATGAGGERFTSEIDVIGGDYLQALGVRLLEGRWFRDDEIAPSNDSALIDARLARKLWPSGTALGQRVCVSCTLEAPNNWKRVVGVVTPAEHIALDAPQIGSVYLAGNGLRGAQFLVLRTSRPGGETASALRRAIAAIDPQQPVFLTATMRELITDSTAGRRFIVILLAITGCLALILSAAGVYGVISYVTSRRTREIGIRMAIGAAPANILTLVFQQGFRTVAIGLAIGLAASAAASLYLRGVIAGLEAADPLAIGSAVLAVVIASAAACLIPARRATSIHPVTALRHE